MANTASYVSTGKPNVAGAVYVAPLGTALPTNATSTLDPAKYVCLGYVSEDGLENANEMDVSDIKEWVGNIVYRPTTSAWHSLRAKTKMSLRTFTVTLMFPKTVPETSLLLSRQKIRRRRFGFSNLHSVADAGRESSFLMEQLQAVRQ